jgi:hypothetical protein
MPPPLQSDEFIRRLCPQNHPPPLKKVYNIAPTNYKFEQIMPGLKPAAPVVTSPLIMNTMAKALIKDNTQNAKALMMAQQGVMKIYEKPSPDIEKLMNPDIPMSNLRGSVSAEMDVGGNVLNLAQ